MDNDNDVNGLLIGAENVIDKVNKLDWENIYGTKKTLNKICQSMSIISMNEIWQ